MKLWLIVSGVVVVGFIVAVLYELFHSPTNIE